MTQRLKLTIAYDGRPFRGWQSQAGGGAVQDHIEEAFAKLCGRRIVVHGSGRTDSSVHALGQIAHVDVPREKYPLEVWQSALNGQLPREIRILRVVRARKDFHARFDAQGKTYRYRLWCGPFLHPLEIGRAWHLPAPLDVALLRECARHVAGKHDFAAFGANRGRTDLDTVRTLEPVQIVRSGSLVTLAFSGDGFLYHMVRLLTGTLVRCGQGRAEPDTIKRYLSGAEGRKAHYCAPPDGLYLVPVRY